MNEEDGRIQTRRSSRSARSVSPDSSSPEPVDRVTRSQSVESSGYETTDSSRKRKRKYNKYYNKKKKKNKEESERETRHTVQRMTKEAREAKKAHRDSIIKERLSELDKLEKAVRDGSHTEYHRLLGDIEQKRNKMTSVAEIRRSLAEGNINNFFQSQRDIAYSQYYWDKVAIRRSMIDHVQQKINTLEEEYYSNHSQSSLDDNHLNEWVPPDRPSVISSLTLGIPEEEATNDVEWAKQDPFEDHSDTPESTDTSMHLLKSLVDSYPSDTTYTPLNQWRTTTT
ncbi:hypothetical protein BDB01DRAFT_800834 [Pilobolus umbonatus]|nr:hypothetical protein BDB01DRAFT_800834 [Pilobolus umbonatus]